jgi:hypothetical protein
LTAEFLAQWIAPALGTALLLAALARLRTAEALDGAWRRGALPWFLATRVGWLLLVHLVLRPAVVTDLVPWARFTRQMEGGTPGIDFNQPYAPGLPWLLYGARHAVPGGPPWAILLLFVAADAGLVLLGRRAAVAALGTAAGTRVGLFLLLDPLGWNQIVLRAQDESLFALPLAAAALLASRGRALEAGAALGAGLLATKATLAPYALAVILGGLGSRGRVLGLAGFALVAGAGYGLAEFAGMRPVHHVMGKADHTPNFGQGLSLADGLVRLAPGIPRRALLAGFGAACVAAVALAARAPRPGPAASAGGALRGIALVQCATMLFQPSCVSPYLGQGLAGSAAVAVVAAGAAALAPPVAALAALGLLACWHWTQAPVVGPAIKAGSVLFHLWLARAAFRWDPGAVASGAAAAPGAPA